ncbi:exosome complex component RRP45 [Dendroctonus ponderosae]|uniref:exosome complex component RRP45 n=1 Tax=Dendroctonus ponderosae TaxID=77166 RepID=UPI00203552DA|nr:exosome complex component RRP45 [Dendroctonus ponderosae]KAH1027914.1 hypothetical protein HUJ05_001342 [Dendroctonus ponderosae]KAH1027915.1 hypothetical protein HUJ05_001342 [Dendroctonus ponderosae]KAH1027916.1 hypothetical protein HUJ05_001342 [Dendroctonus ponderosae]
MSHVRKTIISNAEKLFLVKNLTEWKRLDGRAFDEFRDLEIQFGKDWGSCFVSLGKTKVLAQVSCELQLPKASRPSEGILSINLELNTMGDPNFQVGRQSELNSQLNRLLEKCIYDSKAVDLESLCVKMNERVWSIRVDVNLLNHEGNILDCASIAALAALAHFRRPDVSCDGMEFKIHSIKERDPIPTVIHHYPVCISYAIFSGGKFIVADPTLLEERVAEAFLSVGLNAYKELCGLHLGGKAELSTDIILETTNKASKRAGCVVEIIKAAVEKDTNDKLAMKDTGFHVLESKELKEEPLAALSVCLDHWKTAKLKKKKQKKVKEENVDSIEMETDEKGSIKNPDVIMKIDGGTAELIPNNDASNWIVVESDEDQPPNDDVHIATQKVATVNLENSDSEDEEKLEVLFPEQQKKSTKRLSKKIKGST